MIELPEDFPVNCFLCPLDPAEAAAEIRARLLAARLDALLRILKPEPPPRPVGEFALRPLKGLKRVKILREQRPDVELYLSDRESDTRNLAFLGRSIACVLSSLQGNADYWTRRKAAEAQAITSQAVNVTSDSIPANTPGARS